MPCWTTPHMASRKSDMKRMRRSAATVLVPSGAEVGRRGAPRSRPRANSWLMEKLARSKKRSPIPAYSQSTMRMPVAVVDEVRVQEVVVAGTSSSSARACSIGAAISLAQP